MRIFVLGNNDSDLDLDAYVLFPCDKNCPGEELAKRKRKSKHDLRMPQNALSARETFVNLFEDNIGQEKCQADKPTDLQERSLLSRKAELRKDTTGGARNGTRLAGDGKAR